MLEDSNKSGMVGAIQEDGSAAAAKPARRGRPPRGDGKPYAPPNRLKFWILTALEEIGEAGPHTLACWFEERVHRERLGDEDFRRLRDTISEKCRVMAIAYYNHYVTRRCVLIQYPGEARPHARYVYKVSAYGRRILEKMRDGRLHGAPY